MIGAAHLLTGNRYHPYLRKTAPQMIGAALRLTGAALQLIGAALQLIGTTLIFDILPLR